MSSFAEAAAAASAAAEVQLVSEPQQPRQQQPLFHIMFQPRRFRGGEIERIAAAAAAAVRPFSSPPEAKRELLR